MCFSFIVFKCGVIYFSTLITLIYFNILLYLFNFITVTTIRQATSQVYTSVAISCTEATKDTIAVYGIRAKLYTIVKKPCYKQHYKRHIPHK